jgi:hypothetical protein
VAPAALVVNVPRLRPRFKRPPTCMATDRSSEEASAPRPSVLFASKLMRRRRQPDLAHRTLSAAPPPPPAAHPSARPPVIWSQPPRVLMPMAFHT